MYPIEFEPGSVNHRTSCCGFIARPKGPEYDFGRLYCVNAPVCSSIDTIASGSAVPNHSFPAASEAMYSMPLD